MGKKVYILILNWNGLQDAIECIESVKKNDYDNFKIAVVDNGSNDNSASILRNRFPDISVIENGRNFGFAGGNNAGIDYAMKDGADYILLLNNDTTVEKDFLSRLIEAGESDEKIGLLEPKICYWSEPEIIWFAGGKINRLGIRGTHIGLNEPDRGKFNLTREVDFLTGCSLLIKRAVIEEIGTLSEDYFLYYEDTDYCLRAKKSGFKCLYAPKSKIYHKVSRSTKPGSPSYIYYHTRNGLMLAKRNGNVVQKVLIYPYCIYLFLKQILKIILIPKKKEWAKAVIKGEKDFLLGVTGQVKF